MPDYIGNIAVREIVPSGVFPLTPDYPFEVRRDHEVVVHQFGSGNAKIEQRFLIGSGARRFIIRKPWLRDSEREALRDFWELEYGPYGAFYFNAPNADGQGTTQYICRFANEPLSWEMLNDAVSTLGVTLIEIPQTSPSYILTQTVSRFPPQALKDALLSQVQEIIRLIRIVPKEAGYPAIYLSDRRCTISGQIYLARLLECDGISQSISNESDEARFVFGNADRVMRALANDVDLFRASIEFSLFHVGTGIKLDLWKGVRIKDNSTGVWGFGRSTLTSVSLVADSIYDEVVPEIYTDSPMPVNAKIAMGREESDFYAAVGIVGEGPPRGLWRQSGAVRLCRDALRCRRRRNRSGNLRRAGVEAGGSGTETQFKFRGILQEEKPLRDWLQEVLMNCLGYYTFANGKLKIGVRVNS